MGVETLVALGVGAETAASIGAVTSAIGTITSIGSGIMSVMGGISGQQAGNQQSEYALAQAEMAGKESARQASVSAMAEKQNYEETLRKQKLAYMKSGVTLEGSPLLIMEETRLKGESNVDEILYGGAYAKTAAATEGRMKADQLKSAGRQSLVSGITSGVNSLTKLAK